MPILSISCARTFSPWVHFLSQSSKDFVRSGRRVMFDDPVSRTCTVGCRDLDGDVLLLLSLVLILLLVFALYD